MDIYVKPVKKASVTCSDAVLIKDFAEVVAVNDVVESIKNMSVLDMKEYLSEHSLKDGKTQVLVSITDIIRTINKAYPDYVVHNVGEKDTIIDYSIRKKTENKYWKSLKIAFVSMVLLTGSSTAIMSFHTDAEMPKIFRNYYRIFFGEETDKPYIIDIPYSIGLGMGIIIFFNHFAGRKITQDPTPIEVEMSLYDNDVTDTVIEALENNNESRGAGSRDKTDKDVSHGRG